MKSLCRTIGVKDISEVGRSSCRPESKSTDPLYRDDNHPDLTNGGVKKYRYSESIFPGYQRIVVLCGYFLQVHFSETGIITPLTSKRLKYSAKASFKELLKQENHDQLYVRMRKALISKWTVHNC